MSEIIAPEGHASVEARRPSRAFGRYAWGVLGYCLLVIIYGAWVRITGSGAGCGEHWPTCHGEVIPRSPGAQTIIEFTHRLTSGVLGPLILGLVVGAFRARLGLGARVAAVVTALLVVFEALLGAGLVLKGLVADDASAARAWVVALHLGNTLLLVGACTLTAFFGSGGVWTGPTPLRRWVAAALFLTALIALSGAVTALGDTLFPVQHSPAGQMFSDLRAALGTEQHFLVQLRVIHPTLAILFGAALLVFATRVRARLAPLPARVAFWLSLALAVQLFGGAANIVLAAPGWLQLLHLLGAQLVWVLLVLFLATVRPRVSAPP